MDDRKKTILWHEWGNDIPYAAPPTGNLRWHSPKPVNNNKRVKESAIQLIGGMVIGQQVWE